MISHLLYADELLLFSNRGKKSIRNIMRVLQSYERMSCQRVNPSTSSIYFSSSFSLARKEDVMRISSFMEGNWPCIYLGVPLHVGRLRLRMFDPFLAKV